MKLRDTIWAPAVVLLFCATIAQAQDSKQGSQSAAPISSPSPMDSGESTGFGGAPVGAARGVSAGYDPQPYDPAQVVPDNNTLSGAELFGLGSLDHAHNTFDPSISFSELGQSQTGGTQSGLASATIFNGILNFGRTWSRYHLNAVYNGGETFNMGPSSSNAPYHDLIVVQQIDWERWHVLLRDDFTATPGAAFTGTGMGGPGLIAQFSSMLGSSLSSFGQTFTPGETIETGNAMRYRNAVLGQAEYSFSRRSAFTFSGSYGILHFPNAGYVSSHMLNAQGGYDYLLDPRNSIAILASYGKIDYTGTANSTTDYTAALAYGRKITGRMALQVGVGPQQIRSASTTGNFVLWFLSVKSALAYERRRSGVSLSYERGLGAGSGVFLGSTSNTFTGTAHYQFTRFWRGTVSSGYALNNSLAPAGVMTMGFNDWFTGASLGRRVGAYAQVDFNYGLQRQSAPTSCPVASCGGTGFQQTFGMTVNWHLRPSG